MIGYYKGGFGMVYDWLNCLSHIILGRLIRFALWLSEAFKEIT